MAFTDFELLKSNKLFGLLLLDARGIILEANKFYCQLLDYSPNELVGKNISELDIEEEGLELITVLLQSAEKRNCLISFNQVNKTGQIFNIRANVIADPPNEYFVLIIQNLKEFNIGKSSSSDEEVQKLRHAIDASNEGIWEWDAISDTHIWSDRAYTMLGYLPGEFIIDRNKFSDLIHPDDRSFPLKPGTSELLKYSDNRFSIRSRFRCKDGAWKMIISRGKAVEFDSCGNPIRFIGTHIDIDEKGLQLLTGKKVGYEKKLANSRWEYWTDPDGNPVCVSSSCNEITGYSFNEFIDDPQLHVKIIHQDDKTNWELHYKGLKPQNELEIRFRIIRKDGKIIWIHHICTLIYSREGCCLGYHISNKDISDYHKFYESTEKFMDAIEQCPLSILFTNPDERIEYANRKTLEATGYQLNELIGRGTNELIDTNIFNEIRQTLISGKEWKGDFTTKKDLSRTIRAKLQLSRIVNSSGDMNGYMVIGEELTQSGEKGNEELANIQMPEHKRLHRHKNFNKELTEMKTEFVSQASHEFRTRLTSISSSAQMIKRYLQKWNGEKLAEHSNRINQSVSNLNELIDRILTISEIINCNIKVDIEKVNFISWIDQIIEDCSPILKQGQIIVHKTMVNEALLAIDKKLMQRIINNLLTNAIKYSKENSTIIITSKLSNKHLVMSVTDEGIGIDKEDIPFIFDSFYRSGNVKKTKGTGLGLSIVQKAIEFLKGKITVESKLGHGSKFTISVPIG